MKAQGKQIFQACILDSRELVLPQRKVSPVRGRRHPRMCKIWKMHFLRSQTLPLLSLSRTFAGSHAIIDLPFLSPIPFFFLRCSLFNTHAHTRYRTPSSAQLGHRNSPFCRIPSAWFRDDLLLLPFCHRCDSRGASFCSITKMQFLTLSICFSYFEILRLNWKVGATKCFENFSLSEKIPLVGLFVRDCANSSIGERLEEIEKKWCLAVQVWHSITLAWIESLCSPLCPQMFFRSHQPFRNLHVEQNLNFKCLERPDFEHNATLQTNYFSLSTIGKISQVKVS